jgi:hypothetical protein
MDHLEETASDDSLYHLLQSPFLFYFLNSVRKDFTVDSAESPTSVYLYERSLHPDLDPYPDHPVSSFGSPLSSIPVPAIIEDDPGFLYI